MNAENEFQRGIDAERADESALSGQHKTTINMKMKFVLVLTPEQSSIPKVLELVSHSCENLM